jgi:ABC-type sugar transport system permease subunit
MRGYSASRLQNHGYIFILPAIIFFCVFLIYPMLSAFYYSLLDWNLIGPKVFVGLKNFSKMLKDGRVLNSLRVTFHFTVFSVVLLNLAAFAYALLFSSRLIRFKNVLQALIFLPVVLSTVAIGIVWKFMYQETGLLSVLFANVFKLQVPWLTSTKVAPYSLIIVNLWRYTGYYMVIYIAGLLDIPGSLYEAARIDGAGFWAQLRYVTIPSLKNTFTLAVVSCFIFSFGAFPLQYIISQGGPSRSTEVLAILIYRTAFNFTKVGYASAISVLFFLILLVVSIFQLRILKPST